MLSVAYNNVPHYLRQGEFFRSLNEEDEEELLVPQDVLKPDDSVTTAADVTHLLKALRFWGIDNIPESLIEIVLTEREWDWTKIFEPFLQQLAFLPALVRMKASLPASQSRTAIQCGRLDLIQYFQTRRQTFPAESCNIAAAGGHLQCLQHLHERMGLECTAVTMLMASRYGHVSCMKYLHSHGVAWTEAVCTSATENGHAECLRFALQNGCPANGSLSKVAAQFGHLACLAVAIDFSVALPVECCRLAALRGHRQVLQFLHEHGCNWDHKVYTNAIEGNHLDCFIYAYEQGCPWHVAVTNDSIHHANVEFLRYAVEHGCPVDAGALNAAAGRGSLPCMQYLENCGLGELTVATFYAAAHTRSLSVLEYLHQRQCPWDASVCTAAAQWGNLETLQFLHEHGCPWSEATYKASGYYTHVKKYLQEHGCPGAPSKAVL